MRILTRKYSNQDMINRVENFLSAIGYQGYQVTLLPLLSITGLFWPAIWARVAPTLVDSTKPIHRHRHRHRHNNTIITITSIYHSTFIHAYIYTRIPNNIGPTTHSHFVSIGKSHHLTAFVAVPIHDYTTARLHPPL